MILKNKVGIALSVIYCIVTRVFIFLKYIWINENMSNNKEVFPTFTPKAFQVNYILILTSGYLLLPTHSVFVIFSFPFLYVFMHVLPTPLSFSNKNIE